MSGWRSSARPAALLVVLAMLAAGCGKRDGSGSAPRLPVLRLSQRNEPANLDPATATLPDEFAILRAISEGLLIPGEHGEPQPGVAERFDISADGLTYTFHLRADATWSDGEPVTAAQFVDSYRRVLTPATAAAKASVFFPVKNARAFLTGALTDFGLVGLRAADARTLVVTLERVTPRFPYYVVSAPWLPVRVDLVAKHGRRWTAPGNFIGNGPFTLEEWRPDQRIVVKRNPRWHGAAEVRLGGIQFLRFDNGDSEERAYRAGQVDVTMAVPFSKIDTYAQERPAELHRAPMVETRAFCFNTRRPALADPRIRRALALALDRRNLVDRVVKGGQPSAERYVPVALREPPADAGPGADVEHRYDPEAARRLLADAGIGADSFPRLEITAWSPSQVPVLEAAQAMWRRELGINCTIAIREARVHWSALRSGDYDIAYISAIPDVADGAQMLGDFVTGAADNFPHWSDRVFDETYARAIALREAEPRRAALIAAERRLLEAAPLTPVYFNHKVWLMSPRVHGWQEDGLWSRCYHTVYLDEK